MYSDFKGHPHVTTSTSTSAASFCGKPCWLNQNVSGYNELLLQCILPTGLPHSSEFDSLTGRRRTNRPVSLETLVLEKKKNMTGFPSGNKLVGFTRKISSLLLLWWTMRESCRGTAELPVKQFEYIKFRKLDGVAFLFYQVTFPLKV